MKILNSNVTQIDNDIYSYDTKDAVIEGKNLRKLDWKIVRDWNGKSQTITKSPTTTRHINYVAELYNLNVI